MDTMARTARWQDFVLPLAVVAGVLVILAPLPAALLDVLLALSLAVSVVVLLTTIFVKSTLEFSVFPSVLLATTLGRLVLNIASTRLILTRAATDGLDAAGGVIRGFGEFVTGDRLVVGLVLFIIIFVIQFIVITKGATRISEVAARFALDGLPGKQAAIDADVQAGVIDQAEAQRRRGEVARQADFHGAMDGASKFLRGDAVAGVLITLINIGGGLILGVVDGGMSLTEAADVFTRLTIGDGLVSQVPALLVSLAAGLLVTRTGQRSDLPADFIEQLFGSPRVLAVSGVFLLVLIAAGLPALPLATLGAGCLFLSYQLSKRKIVEGLGANSTNSAGSADSSRSGGAMTSGGASSTGNHGGANGRGSSTNGSAASGTASRGDAGRADSPVRGREERVEDYLAVDPLEIELGIRLIRLADPQRGGDLLRRVTAVRQRAAGEVGIVLPKVRIRDNLKLGERSYRLLLAHNQVAEGVVHPDKLLAIDAGGVTGKLSGDEVRDPATGEPAVWITPIQRERAEALGYVVCEPAAVVASHLNDVVRRHADELLTRDATKHLVDELHRTSPAVVDELIPNLLRLGEVQQVLQLLLREEVPIRQLGLILEALGDAATRSRDPRLLAEQVRQRLARTLCSRYRDREQRLWVVTLDPTLEEQLLNAIDYGPDGLRSRLSPPLVEALCASLASELKGLTQAQRPPVVLVGPELRPALKLLTAARLPRLVVLSYGELTRDTQVEAVGIVSEISTLDLAGSGT